MLTAYDEIELFGLTESADDLPIPCDDTLRDAIVRETFETLFAGLIGTGLHREIEPLAYGLASLLHRRRNLVDAELTKHTDTMRGLVRAVDGSEVVTTQIEDTQAKADRARDLRDALDLMAETAAQCYERQTGAAFLPASGGRRGKLAHMTGAVFEARQWLEAHEAQQAAQFKIDGTPLAIAGDRDWVDI